MAACMGGIMRYRLSYLVGFILLSTSVFGNISKTFRDSLPYASSARYVWSTWDYLTNPYLYALNKKNTVSFILTGLTDFTVASSFLLNSHPVYLSVGANSNSSEITRDPLIGNETTNEKKIEAIEVKAMLGTIIYQDYGLGFYFDLKQLSNTTDSRPVKFLGEPIDLIQVETTSGGNVSRDGVGHLFFGLEFGKYSKALHSFSYSVHFAYQEYGGVGEDIRKSDGVVLGKNNAPFLELSQNSTFTKLFTSNQNFGSRKREIRLDLLTWYVLNKFSNVGVYMEVFGQPSLKGKDSRVSTIVNLGQEVEELLKKASLIPSVFVTSYGIVLKPFYDLDFWYKFGVFRITPSLQAAYRTELAQFDTELPAFLDGSVSNNRVTFELMLAFKSNLYLNKEQTFSILFGWEPSINLYHVEKQEITNVKKLGLAKEPHRFKYSRSRGILDLNGTYKDISLGLQYVMNNKIYLHMSLTSDRTSSKFNLSQVDFGADYQL